MKITFLALLFLAILQDAANAQETKNHEKVIVLAMPPGDGRNGASVAFHPVQQKYYAAFAGNPQYPMAVFDLNGKRLSKDELRVGFDLRGLWYNSQKKTLQGNGYKDLGWTSFMLNEAGIPTGNKPSVQKMSQPTEQSAGVFDDKRKVVYFLADNRVISYDLNGLQKTETRLVISADTSDQEAEEYLPERYNSTALIFTGMDNAEWGLLDVQAGEVVLFDRKSGNPSQKWSIGPEGELPVSLGFAYANGILFIFNRERREWIGYK